MRKLTDVRSAHLTVPVGYEVRERSFRVGRYPGAKDYTWILDDREVGSRGALDEVMDKLVEAATGLDEPRVWIDTEPARFEDDYSETRLYVSGWRRMTESEIELVRESLAEIERQKDEWDQRQIDTMKARHPELFK